LSTWNGAAAGRFPQLPQRCAAKSAAVSAWYDARRELCVPKLRGKTIRGKKLRKKTKGKTARGGSESLARLSKALEESRLIRDGDRVGVAVSGGADSVALLLLLVKLRQKLGIGLHVLHFNHKLRGRAADADEKFVSQLAAKLKLPFQAGSAEIKVIAARAKENVEAAARRARYVFFAQATGEHELDKIAVAHTADDQAETVLAHILRGSGITGLGGIHPQVGKVVRPLLSARRADLRTFLKSQRQTWREDATNRDTAKLRARIRKKLVPMLEKEFQPRVVEHLAALSVHAREDDATLNRLAEARVKSAVEMVPEGSRIRIDDLLAGDFAAKNSAAVGSSQRDYDAFAGLSSRVVRLIVHKMKANEMKTSQTQPRGGELTALHVARVLELARHGESGASLPLPGGIEVRHHPDALVFCNATKTTSAASHSEREYEYEIDFLLGTTLIQVPELGCAFRFTVIDWLGKRGETSISGEVLDGALLRFPLTLRSWRHGDRFRVKGHTRPEKLKRLFNEQRIDRWQRDGWPVLVSDGVLAWSRGFGSAAEFAVHDATQTGIVIVEEKLS
jgi:tRNA(Ile)-lysidine synthase